MIKQEIIKILNSVGVEGEIELSVPPKLEMGDFAFACFDLAKEWKINPAEAAEKILKQVQDDKYETLDDVKAFGPYVNFYIDPKYLVDNLLDKKSVKKLDLEKGKKVMVEFAHPNTLKAFHIGHLRNITTGESIVRILENAGYKVIRANYQGDVGMQIAKCLYGISQTHGEEIYDHEKDSLQDKAKLLGRAYAYGAKEFEDNAKAREEIVEINDKIYSKDKSIKKLYETTREWSLDYFDKIYKRVGSHFDRLYFESEVYEKGIKIVNKFLKKGIFEVGEGGAIIFPGSKYGLHDRVFLNSKGFPTYEAKDQALARLQLKEYEPEKILHIVAKEQTEYFKVIFKALEFTYPKSKGKEEHVLYGWVDLKEGKMSSRTGKVVLGEWLLDEVAKEVESVMKESEIENKQEVTERVSMSAVKYAMLKTGVKNDIKFDLKESVKLQGDSGPYLLYIVARIKSILRKENTNLKFKIVDNINTEEKNLLLKLSSFEEVCKVSAENYDPSQIAKYLFELAKSFNVFYDKCPVLKAEEMQKNFRLVLIKKVGDIMEKGLYLLGIKTVDKM